MRRFLKVSTLVISLTVLAAGCAEFLGVEGVSVMATEKTLGDHIVSYSSGKDCSTLRKDRGLTYCKEDEKIPPMNVFCYNTLGEVTCYREPVFDGHQDRVQQGGEKPR